MLGIVSIWIFLDFGIFKCIYNEIAWEWDPLVNTKFTYMSYKPYIHRLNIVLYYLKNKFIHAPKFHDVELPLVASC